MNKLLIICGPTATGKTDLALHLAKKFDGELVSADSRQVYIGMDIGTGKDLPVNVKFKIQNAKLQIKDQIFLSGFYDIEGIPLWLIDMAWPDQAVTVSHYREIARYTIRDIWNRGKLPIVVGGTGLYIRSLIESLPAMDIPPNPLLRKVLENKKTEELVEILKQHDFKKWGIMNQSDRNNPRRLIRAIEIANYKKGNKIIKRSLFAADTVTIGLTIAKDELFRRIDQRVKARIEQGIVAEVERLLLKGYGWNLLAMDSLGYKEWRSFFEGKKTVNEVIDKWKVDEHKYAERQMTWFKKQQNIHWLVSTDPQIENKCTQIVASWYTKTR